MLNNEEELEKCLELETNKKIDVFKQIPYQIKFYKFNSTSEGVVLLKLDHSLSDGVGIISYNCFNSDNFNYKKFPEDMLLKGSLSKILLDIVTLPYYIFISMKAAKDITSPFNKENNTGFSKLTITKNYNYLKLKKIADKNNVKFSDIFISILSTAFSNHFENNKITNFIFILPTGSNPLPKNLNEYNIINSTFGNLCLIPTITFNLYRRNFSIHIQRA